MEFQEIKKDLFSMPEEYCLAHCISADAKMGLELLYSFGKDSSLPEIGCGLDKLQWEKVKEIIMKEFKDTPIQITVCRL
ncbi:MULTISPECIES: hypothetical protein [Paenibacillus]|uniref:Uncharacterized protein n=1 Tax=Paenibacillus borealis TaxID=160799 RepID=A0ABX3GWK1_PAEBO|nr:hypothetical protein [Paenibacillus borealis]OMD39202.1 hypothetical protein BSK56_29800 [Paenibacillus borealis]